jgi:hypothetical protein
MLRSTVSSSPGPIAISDDMGTGKASSLLKLAVSVTQVKEFSIWSTQINRRYLDVFLPR